MKDDINNMEIKGLKIAMIGHKRIPSREGGIEIAVEELSSRLASYGHTVHAYNRKGHHVSGKVYDGISFAKEYKGIKIRNIPTFRNKKLNALVYSVLATFRALFGRFDCIHYHGEGPCVMLWLPHLLGIRTVVTIHGLDWKRAKWGAFAAGFLKVGERIAAKYADEVIVLSKNVQEYFLYTYGRKAEFIPNGIEKPENKDDDVIRKKWCIRRDDYILFLGRLVPEKGLSYLLDAYRDIRTSKKLVVAGGSSHTDEYVADIKRKGEADSRVIFTDFVEGEVLEELYSNAYLYVLPSDLEGMSISLLEAMSYGNCCLVSDIPECREVVEEKAAVFKKSNISDLRNKLEGLIQNTDLVYEYKSAASDFICRKYNWNSVAEKTVKLYGKTYIIPNHIKENEGIL